MSANIVRINAQSDQTSVVTSALSGIVALTNTAVLATPVSAATTGSNPGQVNRGVVLQGSVVAGTPLTLNLNTGYDQFNVNPIGMVHLGRVHVLHNGSTGKLTVGAGTHPVMGSDQVTLQPGGSAVFDNCGFGYQVASGAVTHVEPVEALVFVDPGSNGSGSFPLTYCGLTTAAITYSSTAATLVSNINTQLDATFGAGNLVASGSTLAGIIITGSAGNYQYNAFGGHFTAVVTGSNFTINAATTPNISTTTTAGLAAIAGEQDTITFTADVGSIPMIATLLGR